MLMCRASLLRSCWSPTPARRPTASTVLELLQSSPRLLTPSIDVPLASVQIERSDEIELAPSRHRKPSSAAPARAATAEYKVAFMINSGQ